MRSMESTERELPESGDRIFLFRLALADVSLFWLWLLLFTFFGMIQPAWLLLAGGILYMIYKWSPKHVEHRFLALGLLLIGMGTVLVGMEFLLQQSAKFLADSPEPPQFIYALAYSHWWGAALGFFCGVVLEIAFLIPGISWMAAVALILAGISSLGTAWGFVLALPLVASLHTLRNKREASRRLRAWMMLAFSLIGFLLTPYLEIASQHLLNRDYSPMLRWQQLNLMILVWLGVETAFALIYFHFKYGRSVDSAKV
jgi:Na+/phosphate symporter